MASSCVPGLNLPSGFKFLPTNEELLGYYLLNKVRGKPFKYDSRVMNEFNLYKTEPWDLWTRFGGPRLNQGEDLFIFTELKKVNDNGSNVSRTAGSGTWKGDTAGAKVYDSEDKKKILGSWKRFHYVPNEPNENGSWIMFEYKLDDSLIPKSCIGRDLVLCRIRKDRKRKLIEDQMNDTPQSSRRKVPRVDKHDVMFTHRKHIMNDDTNLPASFTQGLGSEDEEQQSQQRQQLDSNKSFEEQEIQQEDPQPRRQHYSHFNERQQQLLVNDLMISSDQYIFGETYDPMNIVRPNPNAVISHQPNNLGIPSYFHEQQQQLLSDDLMVSCHLDKFQRVDKHESYVMYTCENQILNDEDYNLMASSVTRWLSSDEEKQHPQQQQEVEPNNMCAGQHSSVSFEREEQQLQQQDQQLLPSTSDFHEKQQQLLGNDLMVCNDHDIFRRAETYEPMNVQPNPDTLISHQPNHLSIPIDIDAIQFDDYWTPNELLLVDTNNDPYTAAPDSVLDTSKPLQMQDSAANDNNEMMRIDESHDQTQLGFPQDSNTTELSDSAAHNEALNFSTLDDNVFNAIDLDNLW
ncbi:NAC domain-containing protein 26-like [Rosa chinensis]|uniref:NAC domain-containing protein 26-like n=1 Tax=Rosa chinensis TaxID=74649 RepID=UPI000D08D187|nr:NAC domain-containing protein 26-like [Rosa chinensis]